MSGIKLGAFGFNLEVTSTESILNRIQLIQTNKDVKISNQELNGLVSELIDEKEKMLQIIKLYESKFIDQFIDEKEITTICDVILPVIKEFSSGNQEQIEMIEKILTKDILSVLQIIGFDYKEAIGKPLTELCAYSIRKNVPTTEKDIELQIEKQKSNQTYQTMLCNPEAIKAHKEFNNIKE